MKKIIEIKQISRAFPAQWEIRLLDGRLAYVRYRHGVFTVEESLMPTNDIYLAMEPDGVLKLLLPVKSKNGEIKERMLIRLLALVGYEE